MFRNDFAAGNAALALRLTGTKSNRDAVGARVTVETDQGRATRIVKAGSGFISQHSKELLFGLGKSQRVVKATIVWPSGLVQTLLRLPIGHRVWIEEGSDASARSRSERPAFRTPALADRPRSAAARPGTWLYQPVPRARLHASGPRRTGAFALGAGRAARADPVLGDVGAAFAPGARGVVAPTPVPRRSGRPVLTVAVDRRRTSRRSGPQPRASACP